MAGEKLRESRQKMMKFDRNNNMIEVLVDRRRINIWGCSTIRSLILINQKAALREKKNRRRKFASRRPTPSMEPKEAIANYPWSGEEKIFDHRRKVDNANLHHGRCVMDDDYKLDIMIRKGSEIKKDTYDIMNNFQHVTCIPFLAFYNESNMGRLTLPSIVKSFFDNWIKDEGQQLLLDEQGNMSSLFKTMICDFCDMVEKLGHRKILIRNLNLKNLYVADETTPRILVLVTERTVIETTEQNGAMETS
uniref:Uncharacterized protein n=1 Tax=Oryza brachyantha TaxID=4533 RepID=J3N5B4_ORYBR